MNSVLPSVEEQGVYSTGQTCEMLGISRNTLVKYTRAGKIRARRNTLNGRIFYIGTDIKKFWIKTFLK